MEIRQVREKKKRYLSLLLLADEQEDMIDRYLDRGTMYVLEDGGVTRAVCVVTDEGGGVLELKNLAVDPAVKRRGYGRKMIEFLAKTYRGRFSVLQVSTGDSPNTVLFYESCGFTRSHIIPNYFPTHYDHPIYENGVLLRDRICLYRSL